MARAMMPTSTVLSTLVLAPTRTSSWLAGCALVLALAAASLAGCGSTSGDGDSASGGIELEILDVGAIKDRIASYKDKKIVVVDFWSTSCQPCMEEFPGLVALAEKHPSDVACISVSLDYEGGKNKKPEDSSERVRKFLQSQKAGKVTNILSSTENLQVLDDPGLALGPSIPAVAVYARSGDRVKLFGDPEPFTYADVNELVDELLAGK